MGRTDTKKAKKTTIRPRAPGKRTSKPPRRFLNSENEKTASDDSKSNGQVKPRVAPIVEKGKSMYVNGSLEAVTVKFLVDTGAEATAINFDLLAKLSRVTKAAFNGKKGTLITASGERVPVRSPVPCKITVAGRKVLESVYATPFPEAAILGMPALAELGCNVTIAGIEVVPTKTRSIMQR